MEDSTQALIDHNPFQDSLFHCFNKLQQQPMEASAGRNRVFSKSTGCESGEQEHSWKGSRPQSNQMLKVRASCHSTKLISSYSFCHKTDSSNLLTATRENLGGSTGDGMGGSGHWGTLRAVVNVPSDYSVVNVVRLEMVVWEHVLDSHSAFWFFRLLVVRKNAIFMF